MLDPVLRDAERAYTQSGAETDAARVLAARLRAGAIDGARVRAAAFLDDRVAVLVVGTPEGPPPPVPPGLSPRSALGWVLSAAGALPGLARDELVVRAALAALEATWTAWTAWLEDTARLTAWQARATAWLRAPVPGAADLLLKAQPVLDDSATLASDEAVRAAVRAAVLPWLLAA